MKNKILIVAAHPDDEILGCGGTVARMVKEGAGAYTLILGEGVTSRDSWTQKELRELHEQATRANKIIGVDIPILIDKYPDNKFDTVSLIQFVKTLETMLDFVKPSIVFTHFKDDLNIDHRITYQAVITATRPMQGQTVKEIYSFEIPSSTEWAFPTSFSPDVFWDITETLDKKIEALQCYDGEVRQYPHPRSIYGIQYLAGYRGMQCGCNFAEALKTVRVIR